MHIAKTAGSYVNEVIRTAVGERFVEHCEARGRLDTDKDIAVWSGHIFFPQWKKIEAQKGWNTKCLTLLREPISQTASHILWLDHYAQPEFEGEYRMLDPNTREVVDQIAATDLSDAGDLDRLLISLSGRGVQYLDNCQSRYFIAGSENIDRQQPLHLGMRKQVLGAMKSFAVIGVGEQMDDFVSKVSKELDVELVAPQKRVNSSKSKRAIDLTNPQVRGVISKRCTLDNWLYRRVLNS